MTVQPATLASSTNAARLGFCLEKDPGSAPLDALDSPPLAMTPESG